MPGFATGERWRVAAWWHDGSFVFSLWLLDKCKLLVGEETGAQDCSQSLRVSSACLVGRWWGKYL